jgi:drug/metabolite transporter (DMT)-like permease
MDAGEGWYLIPQTGFGSLAAAGPGYSHGVALSEAWHLERYPMRAREWLLLVLLSILWGGTFFVVAIAVKELPPMTLVLCRCLFAALLLAPVVWAMGLKLPATGAAWREFAVMSVLNNIIPFSLIFYAQTIVPSGLASVLNATTPLFALLVAWWFANDPLPANKLIGIALGIAGVVVLIGPSAMEAKPANVIGMLAILAASLSYGVSGFWGRRLKAYPPLVTSLSQLTCSSLLLIPIAGVSDQFWRLPWPNAHVVWAVLWLAAVSTALAYILFFEIMAKAGSANVMLVTLLIPFSAIALGAIYLGEVLTWQQALGGVIIGVGLLVIDGRIFGFAPSAPPAFTTKAK